VWGIRHRAQQLRGLAGRRREPAVTR
jgi:hypothetical protein